jgi:hypothetical protein
MSIAALTAHAGHTAKLRTLVLIVRGLTLIGVAMVVLLPLWFWQSPEAVRALGHQLAGLARDTSIVVDVNTLRWGALLSTVPIGLALASLWHLWRLFGEYAQQRVFSRTALHHLRRFATWSLVAAVAAPLIRAAGSVLLTMNNPPGQRMLVVNLSWHDYLGVLFGVVFWSIAMVMSEAVRVAEENESFV